MTRYRNNVSCYRKRGRQDGYQVKWQGYDEKTWEPAIDLRQDIPEIVENFEKSRTPTARKAAPANQAIQDSAVPDAHPRKRDRPRKANPT